MTNMEKEKRKTQIANLRERAEKRKEKNNGKIHSAKQENEFFLRVKDDIYKQIIKE